MIFKFLTIIFLSIVLSACLPSVGNSGGGSKKGADEYSKGGVVKGFPNIPYFDKSKVVESYGFEGKFGASMTTEEQLDKVIDFYNKSLNVAGWDFTFSKKSETNYVFDIKNSENEGFLIINTTADGEKTGITIAVEPR
jgi:hypothetical protein